MDSTARPARDEWAPRIWLGCDFFAWLRLLWLGRFRFGLRQLRLLPIGTCLALGHTLLRYVQSGLYGERIREAAIVEPPLFILGHWRSGTTLLHELLVRDPRHTFPTTYQCFDPSHFLISERFARDHLNWLLPSRRLMDNMPIGWDRPQEEEFALALSGAPSPYCTIAFPNRGPLDHEALELDYLPRYQREKWKKTLLRFLKTIAVRDARRIILKSPPHTCRIPTLLELFPHARFVYIIRDPVAVFFSTVHLWKTLYRTQGLHTPTYRGLEEYVFETFLAMDRRYQATRDLIPAGHRHELRYEDLVARPIAELEQLYAHLGLGDFAPAREPVQRYLTETARYERNRWEFDPRTVARVCDRWGEVIRRYGYDRPRSSDRAA